MKPGFRTDTRVNLISLVHWRYASIQARMNSVHPVHCLLGENVCGGREVFRSNCRSLREGYACLWGLENTDLRLFWRGTIATIRHRAAGTPGRECGSSRKLLFVYRNRDQMGVQFFDG